MPEEDQEGFAPLAHTAADHFYPSQQKKSPPPPPPQMPPESEIWSFSDLETASGELFKQLMVKRDFGKVKNTEKRVLFILVDLMNQVLGWCQVLSSDEFNELRKP